MGAALLDMPHSMLLLSLRLLALNPAQTYHRAFVPMEVWYLKSTGMQNLPLLSCEEPKLLLNPST